MVGALVDTAKHIHPAIFENITQPGAFFGQETRVLAIAAPVLQIDFVVRDVQVTADDKFAPFGLHGGEVRTKHLEKTKLRLLPVFTAGARRQINRDQRHGAEIGAHIATFVVKLAHTKTNGDSVRLTQRINPDAAIAFFFRVVKMAVITRRGEHIGAQISRLSLELLHADQVGFLLRKPVPYAFGCSRSNAVEIEGDYA